MNIKIKCTKDNIVRRYLTYALSNNLRPMEIELYYNIMLKKQLDRETRKELRIKLKLKEGYMNTLVYRLKQKGFLTQEGNVYKPKFIIRDLENDTVKQLIIDFIL